MSKPQDSAQPKASRILVIRYRFIGDTILTGPFLRNLRYAYPQAKIDVLVGPQSGEVLRGCPYVDDLIVFDTTRFHKYDSAQGKAKSFWSYVFQLRKKKYDLVFVLKRSFSAAFLAWSTGARYRVGYARHGRSVFLTHPIAHNADVHEVESTLDVLRAGHIAIVDKELEAWISPQEDADVKSIVPQLESSQARVLIHAAAAHPDKVYPLESWAEVVKSLGEEEGMVPYFTGAPMDYELYEQLQELSQTKGVNLAGKLSLRQSMALYKHMDLAICVDSGPAHLAAAAGVPTAAIFGPTDPVRWGPFGSKNIAIFDAALACRPCHYKKTCDDRACLTKLPPRAVLEGALAIYHRFDRSIKT
jgi:heptosyltransferase-2